MHIPPSSLGAAAPEQSPTRMNISPSISTSPTINVSPDISEQPVPQVSGQVKSICNSSENLSSFEIEMQQTFPPEVLVKIIRKLHPTIQAGHPWQPLLPESYSRMLDHSTKQAKVRNFRALIRLLALIPHDWRHDAVNAICENFIKRIDSFPGFSSVIKFIITNKKLESHSLELILHSLIEQIGKLKTENTFPGEGMALLHANHSPTTINEDEGLTKINNLLRIKERARYDVRLLQTRVILFILEVKMTHWKINNINTESYSAEVKEHKKYLQKEIKRIKKAISILKHRKEEHSTSYGTMIKMTTLSRWEEIKNETENTNKLIDLFNEERHRATGKINYHVFEIINHMLNRLASRLSTPVLDNLRMQMVNSMENLTLNYRISALSNILNSQSCTPQTLAILTKRIDSDFFKTPFNAVILIANKMEVFYNDKENVSTIISVLKSYIEKQPEGVAGWRTYYHLFSSNCKNILRINSRKNTSN